MTRYIVISNVVEAHVDNDGKVYYYTKDWKGYRSWTEKLFRTREDAVKKIMKSYRLCRNVKCVTNKHNEVVYILVESNRFIPRTSDLSLQINYLVLEIRQVSTLTENRLFGLVNTHRKGFT